MAIDEQQVEDVRRVAHETAPFNIVLEARP